MRDFSHHLKPSAYSKKNYRKVVFGIILVFIATGALLYYPKFFDISGKKDSLQPKPAENKITVDIQPIGQYKKSGSQKELINQIDNIIKDAGGTYSVYIYDINKKNGFGINEQTVVTAASVNKIPILAALYHLAGKKEIDLDKMIILQQKDIQDYGSGSIRYATPGAPYSIKTLARLMMEESDNTAAYILASLTIKLDNIQKLIDSWGLTQTDMDENKTSANDMAILMMKMYRGDITSLPLTLEMLGFMDKSLYDDRIPAGLPEGVKVYHKTGDEIGKIHDVGIIDLPNRPYFLGLFSMDATNDEATKKILARISKIVYEYMKNL